jgi:outer membrane receptor protein involved in Fe transport
MAVLFCNYSMIKRAVSAVLGLLAVSLSLAAQDRYFDTVSVDELRKTGALDTAAALTLDRPDVFSTVDSVLLLHTLPVAAFIDGRRFPISGDTSRVFEMFPIAFLNAVDVHKFNTPVLASDAPGGAINLRLNRSYSAGGELGFFYGKSDGKYGGDLFETHIIGGVGNDKFNFTAGAMYERSSGHESQQLQR